MSTSPRFSLALLALAPSLAACLGGAPLSLDDGAAPPACASPAANAPPVAGSAPLRSFSLWMSDGFVRDMRAAGFGGKDSGGDDFEIGDMFVGFVSYGMDIVTLNQGGTLAVDFGIDWRGPPSMLIVQGTLAELVWDGMTNAVVTPGADVTIRESPGGRVHCEQSVRADSLQCGFHGVVRADFR